MVIALNSGSQLSTLRLLVAVGGRYAQKSVSGRRPWLCAATKESLKWAHCNVNQSLSAFGPTTGHPFVEGPPFRLESCPVRLWNILAIAFDLTLR